MQKASKIFVPALLFVMAFLTVLPVAPHLQPLAQTDSSVFLYVGDRLREGAVPYKDVWDHKGPLIYFIQALGLSLVDGSRWGVWALEVLFIFGAAWAGYTFMRKAFGHWPALFANMAFLFHLPYVLDGGNLIEEYALLFQFLFLLSIYYGLSKHKTSSFFFAGMWAACLILLRPNIIGLPLAAGAYLLGHYVRERSPARARPLLAMASGALSLFLPTVLYFAANQALPHMLDAVFAFNFSYSHSDALQQVYSARVGISMLTTLGILALAGWGLALNALRNFNEGTRLHPLLAVLSAALPIEIALSALSGRTYPHYYMSLLPVFASLVAFFVFRIGLATSSESTDAGRPVSHRVAALSLLCGYLMFFFWDFHRPLQTTVHEVATVGFPRVVLNNTSTAPTLEFIERTIPDGDPVLVWGNNLRVNWLSGHPAPSRFVYQSAFFESAYITPELVQELIDALEANPRTIVIDTAVDNRPFLSLGAPITDAPPVLQPLYAYFKANYLPAVKMDRTQWQVYYPVDY